MRINNFWKTLKTGWAQLFNHRCCPDTLRDTVRIDLWGLHIGVSRELPRDVPYELTVVIPRTELRRNCDCATVKKSPCDLEILLNSITIAHSPRFEGTERRLPVIPSNNKER